ncbi:MAG: dihydroorotase [Saprospiraceae bacterium]
MELIIKQTLVLSQDSSFHQKKVDIHIKNGKIHDIASKLIVPNQVKSLEGQNLYCTTGLVDIGTHSGEPGFEHRETILSLAKAARAGGYTSILPFPNTLPYIQTKADLQFLIQKGKQHHINILPIGALSLNGKGVDIAEYYDMFSAGAAGFSDGLNSCQDSGLLLRALLYAKAFDGIIIHHPEDKTLRGQGVIHEGLVSTSLGLKGSPTIAEVSMLQRDLLLQAYANSKMLVHAISSGESVILLQKAKKQKHNIFVSVPYLNLRAVDKNLEGFNVDYKVKPVLREEADKNALIKGLMNGTIDAVISNHVPVDEDGKKVEFPYADYGAGGIETAFVATIDYLGDKMDLGKLVSKFNDGPRKIFGIPSPKIEKGEIADLCIFERGTSKKYTSSFSLSGNNPLFAHTFDTVVRASVLAQDVFEN